MSIWLEIEMVQVGLLNNKKTPSYIVLKGERGRRGNYFGFKMKI